MNAIFFFKNLTAIFFDDITAFFLENMTATFFKDMTAIFFQIKLMGQLMHKKCIFDKSAHFR